MVLKVLFFLSLFWTVCTGTAYTLGMAYMARLAYRVMGGEYGQCIYIYRSGDKPRSLALVAYGCRLPYSNNVVMYCD